MFLLDTITLIITVPHGQNPGPAGGSLSYNMHSVGFGL